MEPVEPPGSSPTELPGVTPARVLLGRAGTAYRTSTRLQLRADHAAARDALHEAIALDDDVMAPLVERYGLFEVRTAARSPSEHLARPDLGRRLAPGERRAAAARVHRLASTSRWSWATGCRPGPCTPRSPSCCRSCSPAPPIAAGPWGVPSSSATAGWACSTTSATRWGPRSWCCWWGSAPAWPRPRACRPTSATGPRAGHTDADRNLVSNIHADGVAPADAARRVLDLAAELRLQQRSGFRVKELGGS